jgi:hypothetical protein
MLEDKKGAKEHVSGQAPFLFEQKPGYCGICNQFSRLFESVLGVI